MTIKPKLNKSCQSPQFFRPTLHHLSFANDNSDARFAGRGAGGPPATLEADHMATPACYGPVSDSATAQAVATATVPSLRCLMPGRWRPSGLGTAGVEALNNMSWTLSCRSQLEVASSARWTRTEERMAYLRPSAAVHLSRLRRV
jgi:hypothetical protein